MFKRRCTAYVRNLSGLPSRYDVGTFRSGSYPAQKVVSASSPSAHSRTDVTETKRHSHFVPQAVVSRCSKSDPLFDHFVGT